MALSERRFSELQSGDILPEIVKHLNQEKVNRYAKAVDDFNPIHVDESFAAQTSFGGTIAHGMLILAYVSEMMTRVFGGNWLSAGKLAIRFKSPARSKDTVTITGKINSIVDEGNALNFRCGIICHNQNHETIITGEASVKVPNKY